jgi:hypothetical protein
MAALTKERPGRVEAISRCKVELGAAVKAWKGGAAVLDAKAASATKGYYVPATAIASQIARGRFAATVDNTAGANGAKKVEIDLHQQITVIYWDNSSGSPCALADRGSTVYFEDDHTVTPDSTTKSAAGRLFDIIDGFAVVEVL